MSFFLYIKNRYLSAKINSIILTVYSLFIIGIFIHCLIINETRNSLLSLLFLSFVLLSYFIEYIFKIKFPPLFIFLVFIVASGGILGSCYNFYTIIPFFDTILHGTTGFVIPCLGFAIMKLFFKDNTSKKSFFACLIFAIAFSLSITVLWEIFEYLISTLMGFDMLEDCIIYDIDSYYLSGSHNILYSVHDINKTIIYYGDNQILTLDGYLDIGLIDTLHDMIIHLICTLLFTIVCVTSYFKYPKINKALIPEV